MSSILVVREAKPPVLRRCGLTKVRGSQQNTRTRNARWFGAYLLECSKPLAYFKSTQQYLSKTAAKVCRRSALVALRRQGKRERIENLSVQDTRYSADSWLGKIFSIVVLSAKLSVAVLQSRVTVTLH